MWSSHFRKNRKASNHSGATSGDLGVSRPLPCWYPFGALSPAEVYYFFMATFFMLFIYLWRPLQVGGNPYNFWFVDRRSVRFQNIFMPFGAPL